MSTLPKLMCRRCGYANDIAIEHRSIAGVNVDCPGGTTDWIPYEHPSMFAPPKERTVPDGRPACLHCGGPCGTGKLWSGMAWWCKLCVSDRLRESYRRGRRGKKKLEPLTAEETTRLDRWSAEAALRRTRGKIVEYYRDERGMEQEREVFPELDEQRIAAPEIRIAVQLRVDVETVGEHEPAEHEPQVAPRRAPLPSFER